MLPFALTLSPLSQNNEGSVKRAGPPPEVSESCYSVVYQPSGADDTVLLAKVDIVPTVYPSAIAVLSSLGCLVHCTLIH